jgi:hypothetical protein
MVQGRRRRQAQPHALHGGGRDGANGPRAAAQRRQVRPPCRAQVKAFTALFAGAHPAPNP